MIDEKHPIDDGKAFWDKNWGGAMGLNYGEVTSIGPVIEREFQVHYYGPKGKLQSIIVCESQAENIKIGQVIPEHLLPNK